MKGGRESLSTCESAQSSRCVYFRLGVILGNEDNEGVSTQTPFTTGFIAQIEECLGVLDLLPGGKPNFPSRQRARRSIIQFMLSPSPLGNSLLARRSFRGCSGDERREVFRDRALSGSVFTPREIHTVS